MIIIQCATIIILAIITLYLLIVRWVFCIEHKGDEIKSMAKSIRREKRERDRAANYGDTYIEATNALFHHLQSLPKSLEEKEFTTKDVMFGNGYFIFEFGDYSVVHFHVNELPGWLFGIWWEPSTKETKLHCNHYFKKEFIKGSCVGTVFAQYEDEIDKFKPSRSIFCEKFTYSQNDDEWCAYQVYEMMKFMRDEPYLAYYMDMHECNLNREYVTRERAKEYYDKETSWRAEEKKCSQEFIEESYNRLYKLFKRWVERDVAYIEDHGENFSPRLEVSMCDVIPLNGEFRKFETGTVHFQDLVDLGLLSQDGLDEFYTWEEGKLKELENIGHYQFSCINRFVSILDSCTYFECKESRL